MKVFNVENFQDWSVKILHNLFTCYSHTNVKICIFNTYSRHTVTA